MSEQRSTEQEVAKLRESLADTEARFAETVGLLKIAEAEIERLKEYEWMYKDLCK